MLTNSWHVVVWDHYKVDDYYRFWSISLLFCGIRTQLFLSEYMYGVQQWFLFTLLFTPVLFECCEKSTSVTTIYVSNGYNAPTNTIVIRLKSWVRTNVV